MTPLDTSAQAHAAQLEVLRRRSGEQRLAMAFQLSEDVLQMSRAGIQARHPEYSEQQLTWALRRLTLGDELFCGAWPDAPLLDT